MSFSFGTAAKPTATANPFSFGAPSTAVSSTTSSSPFSFGAKTITATPAASSSSFLAQTNVAASASPTTSVTTAPAATFGLGGSALKPATSTVTSTANPTSTANDGSSSSTAGTAPRDISLPKEISDCVTSLNAFLDNQAKIQSKLTLRNEDSVRAISRDLVGLTPALNKLDSTLAKHTYASEGIGKSLKHEKSRLSFAWQLTQNVQHPSSGGFDYRGGCGDSFASGNGNGNSAELLNFWQDTLQRLVASIQQQTATIDALHHSFASRSSTNSIGLRKSIAEIQDRIIRTAAALQEVHQKVDHFRRLIDSEKDSTGKTSHVASIGATSALKSRMSAGLSAFDLGRSPSHSRAILGHLNEPCQK